jgi:hypothetical protein
MSPLFCHRLELPLSSTYGAGATVLMATLVDQTSLPWADEFPRKIEREKAGFDVMACDRTRAISFAVKIAS